MGASQSCARKDADLTGRKGAKSHGGVLGGGAREAQLVQLPHVPALGAGPRVALPRRAARRRPGGQRGQHGGGAAALEQRQDGGEHARAAQPHHAGQHPRPHALPGQRVPVPRRALELRRAAADVGEPAPGGQHHGLPGRQRPHRRHRDRRPRRLPRRRHQGEGAGRAGADRPGRVGLEDHHHRHERPAGAAAAGHRGRGAAAAGPAVRHRGLVPHVQDPRRQAREQLRVRGQGQGPHAGHAHRAGHAPQLGRDHQEALALRRARAHQHHGARVAVPHQLPRRGGHHLAPRRAGGAAPHPRLRRQLDLPRRQRTGQAAVGVSEAQVAGPSPPSPSPSPSTPPTHPTRRAFVRFTFVPWVVCLFIFTRKTMSTTCNVVNFFAE